MLHFLREERFLSGSSREKQPDGDLARLVALAVTSAKKGSEKKRLSSSGKSGS